ncbi:hypothetical protein BDV06DRAFT_187162 [Aspergillus oleicola]
MAPSKPPSPAPQSPAAAAALNLNPDYTNPTFDPVDFLNDTLPPLTLQSHSQLSSQSQSLHHSSQSSSKPVTLSDLSTRIQSILSQTNAQNIRHSATLTSLTDDILRSGNRLAYEVEVLRGETITLSEVVGERLSQEMAPFTLDPPAPTSTTTDENTADQEEQNGDKKKVELKNPEPEYISNLRTLNQVRSRLEEVVQTFGDAMEWPLPPSETSLTSSFISVSAPEPGPEAASAEEKGLEVSKKIKNEITELLDGGDMNGIEAANKRVEALRVLASVWKGTAEEKARGRFVDNLVKMVEERRRILEARAQPVQPISSVGSGQRGHQRQESEGPGGGIFRNLQRLREEIYLE